MEPKVLLIYPPTQLEKREARRVDGSLGALYLVGALERSGIEADLLDANVGMKEDNFDHTFDRLVMQDNGLIRIGMTTERISEVIADGGYNIVGVSSIFTPQTRMALEVVRAAKAVSNEILVIAGGVNARSLPQKFFEAGVDVICNTEGEKVIVNLVRAWKKGRRYDIPGTITMQGGEMVYRNPVPSGELLSLGEKPRDRFSELDYLPVPAWSKLPWEHYDRADKAGGRSFLKEADRSGAFQTSRGCPFNCSYCHISNEKEHGAMSGGIGNLRFKSVDRVMHELESLKSLGVGNVYLEDDSLLANKPRMKEILKRVSGMGLVLKDANGVNLVHFLKGGSAGPTIDVEFLELLYEAGMTTIVYPVESASQRLLDKYATGKLDHSKLDVVELVEASRKVGISCPINMMIGFPDETEAEMLGSIDMGHRLVDAGADYCSFKIPVPLPGCRLHDEALEKGYLDPNYDPDIFNWRRAVMKNTTVPPERIEELQQMAERDVNTEEYRRKRLEIQIGTRWESGRRA